ncbi:DUF2937 family protein [Ectopseudomonas mendocina]|uniref:DUF2937 family protein n=1 Tax=Ectopseudomonas mendocina TaxID=300 RepID=A0ABZ2RLH4_ECTME
MFISYLRMVLFALGLLVGIQVPGFIDDYQKRVEAQLLESEKGLEGFRKTAKRFFKGDLVALVGHYAQSADPVMRSDAASLSELVDRVTFLKRESIAMHGPWYSQTWHLIINADQELMSETLKAYRYQVLFAPEVIAWGLAGALLLALLVEGGLLMIVALLGQGTTRRTQQKHWR